MPKPLIFLASASPRRAELLRQIGVAHQVAAVAVDEAQRAGESPENYVQRVALAKASALWSQLSPAERLPVLAADTAVVCEGEVFGKPGDSADARVMLSRLSAASHAVHTAVALVCTNGTAVRLSSSIVRFRALTPQEIDWYCATGEPADKAGGYAVQGRAAIFISHLSGSYSGVMGLPLCETWELLSTVLGHTPQGLAA